MRAGLVRLVEEAGFEVVAEAGDGVELLRKVRGHRPDVAVLGDEALAAARTIRAELPSVGLLVLARQADPAQLAGLGTHRRRLPAPRPDLASPAASPTRSARSGEAARCSIPSSSAGWSPGGAGPARSSGLTRREREVLAGMADGESNRGIARRLFVSERAVERHITAIFAKLAVPDDGAPPRARRARLPQR